MKDYYSILGISQNASEEEIKKAYRINALKHHPDKGGDETKFKEITEAYEVITNKGQQSQQSQEFNFHQQFHNNIFEQFFHMNNGNNGNNGNGNRQIKRNNYIHPINVSLKEIHSGLSKTLKIIIKKNCLKCKIKCGLCNGTGIMNIRYGPVTMQQICNNCNNSGIINKIDKNCVYCLGTLEKSEEKICKIDIPKCAINGDIIVINELGEQIHKQGEIPGDLHFKINIQDDLNFQRQNNNLIYNVPITFKESVVGKNITIPYFDGNINMNTDGFGVINPNKTYSLKNKGLGSIGDLILNFIINYPNELYSKEIIHQFKNIDF